MTPEREVEILKRRLDLSAKYWMRAAKKALDGDIRELANRVALTEAGPLEIVLSGEEAAPSSSPAPGAVEALHDLYETSRKIGHKAFRTTDEFDAHVDACAAAYTALASLSQPAKGEREVLDGGIDGPYNESAPLADVVATAQPALRQECATEGCDNPASVHFVRGDIGSYYCHACYLKVQALTPANPAQVTDARAALAGKE